MFQRRNMATYPHTYPDVSTYCFYLSSSAPIAELESPTLSSIRIQTERKEWLRRPDLWGLESAAVVGSLRSLD